MPEAVFFRSLRRICCSPQRGSLKVSFQLTELFPDLCFDLSKLRVSSLSDLHNPPVHRVGVILDFGKSTSQLITKGILHVVEVLNRFINFVDLPIMEDLVLLDRLQLLLQILNEGVLLGYHESPVLTN